MKYLIIFLLLVASASALTVPAPTTLVNDLANVIPATEEAALEQQLQAIKSSGAAEIAILTIPSLEGQDINEFSIKTAEAWKLGTAEKDNGLLITVAVEDRAYRFEVGYGLEGSLNDARVGRIGRDILVPAFQSNDYAGGLSDSIAVIDGVLQNDPDVIKSIDNSEIPFSLLFFGVIMAGTIIGKLAHHQKTKMRKALVFGIGDIIIISLVIWLASYFLLYTIFLLLITAIPGRGFMPIFLGGGRHGGGGIGGGGSFGGGGAGGKW